MIHYHHIFAEICCDFVNLEATIYFIWKLVRKYHLKIDLDQDKRLIIHLQ